jgi:hypothetical protein
MMTASRASRRLAALFLALILPSTLAAQDEPAPLPMLPETEAAEEEVAPGPRRLLLPDPVTEEQPPVPEPDAPESFEGVSIGRLEAVSVEAIGLLGDGDGGLGSDLWQGAEAGRVIGLLDHLPTSAPSPTMRDVMRRALLTAAAAPVGETSGDFLAARLAGLIGLGAPDDAVRLAALVPIGSASPAIKVQQADALFWSGRLDEACAVAAAEIRVSADPVWLQSMIFCQHRNGEPDTARLSLSLAREQATLSDTARLALAAVLLGQGDTPMALLDSGLDLALTLATEAALDAEILNVASAPALRALALHPEVALETRLAAGERAAALGALSPSELADLYGLPSFSEDELRDARIVAGESEPSLARALLFQAVRQQTDPDQRTMLLAALWAADPSGPGFAPLARAVGVSLLTLTPTPTTVWMAPNAVRALLASDRAPAAVAWYLGLAEAAVNDPAARAQQNETLPMLAAANTGIGRNWNSAMAVQWWRNLPESHDEAARMAVATRVFMILDALGRSIGHEAWALFFDGPSHTVAEIPNVGIRYALRDAARARRRGETVLLTVLALGETGPADADALTLATTIRALRAVGLGEDAEALALEALIGGAR